MNTTMRNALIASAWALASLVLSGIITALIPNPWFVRMVPVRWWDFFFLIAGALLIGVYLYVDRVKRTQSRACRRSATGGGILSFFAVSCPICNKLLVLLLGGGFIMTYIEPIRPVVGLLGLLVLASAIWLRLKPMKDSSKTIIAS